jgi:hypothetical protein
MCAKTTYNGTRFIQGIGDIMSELEVKKPKSRDEFIKILNTTMKKG